MNSWRVPELAHDSRDELAASRLVEILRFENRFLRGLVEGKGRIEADKALQSQLENVEAALGRSRSRTSELETTVERVRSERDRFQRRNSELTSHFERVRAERDEAQRQHRELTNQLRRFQASKTEPQIVARAGTTPSPSRADLEE